MSRLSKFSAFEWICLLAFVFLFVIVRIRFLDLPLERDEGEYAYSAWLFLRGVVPYKLAYSMKLPGMYFVYAIWFKLFGETSEAVRLGLLITNLCSGFLIYLISIRKFSRTAALAGTISFFVLNLNVYAMALWGHATHYVVLFVLLSFYLTFYSRYLSAGIVLGLAILMKQQAIFFVLLFLGCIVFSLRNRFQLILYFLFGLVFPIFLLAVYIAAGGAFSTFWFWVFQYAFEYEKIQSATGALNSFLEMMQKIFQDQWPILLVSGFGLVSALIESKKKIFYVSFFVVSILAVFPGFYFRHHYFILLFPALSFGVSLAVLEKRKKVLFLSALLACFLGVFFQRDLLLDLTPKQLTKVLMRESPNTAMIAVGELIRNNSDENSKIGIFGSEPELLFYSRRQSVSGYVYMYPLMENQRYAAKMQAQMRQEWELEKPEYIVEVSDNSSWLRTEKSETKLFDWFLNFVQNDYRLVGVVDIFSDREIGKWDLRGIIHNPQSASFLRIFRIKR